MERDFAGGPVVKNPSAKAGARVQSLAWEGPTCHRAAKPERHNYGTWASALQPAALPNQSCPHAILEKSARAAEKAQDSRK